jgi:hypothetical protein
MTKPLGNEDLSDKPGQRVIDKPELPAGGITNENDVFTETVSGEMQLKRGTSGKFQVYCDEPARIGGTDKYPSPMAYLAMAIGF